MPRRPTIAPICLAFIWLITTAFAQPDNLPGTTPFAASGDAVVPMLTGIDLYLSTATDQSAANRASYWTRDLTSPDTYNQSVAPNRDRLRTIIGAVDTRPAAELQIVHSAPNTAPLATASNYNVFTIRWPALHNVNGEGLLLEPNDPPRASIVALPDCDWTPEMLAGVTEGIPADAQFARRLAENGCRVIVPLLINRDSAYAGLPEVRITTQPHREFIYRGAYAMGRHIIGYEVQKVLAALDWLRAESDAPTGLIGYGEGGLIAFYAAALDTQIAATVVSGYFQPREALWEEPIYRNTWSLLQQFGDAEIATLIAPRTLIVEAANHPNVTHESDGNRAPGIIRTPPFAAVTNEAGRARALVEPFDDWLHLTGDGKGQPGRDDALTQFLGALGVDALKPSQQSPAQNHDPADPNVRMQQQVHELIEFTQHLMREGEFRRKEFWKDADFTSPETWAATRGQYRDHLWDEVIGRLPEPTLPANPRTRMVFDEPAYRGYEVALDVYRGVFAYGLLLVPKNIAQGERRPVVVCQHGLEGRPRDLADPSVQNEYYHQYGCRLAERGFVVFAPQNCYIGGDEFRVLQRKANPLKLSLFSFITSQHHRALEWLATLPFVDPERIAFYGLSYGGKTAMRVPALLDEYCLSICSADYNEWIWKNVSARSHYSYLYTGEYEMFEFDLGNTFNHAEMSWLIMPRAFMVERGHHDGVAPDEWVAYEFAKTKRPYALMGIGDRAEIEYFNGPHSIHGVGTFNFLHDHLNFPGP